MNNIYRFPAIPDERLAREADAREQVMWDEYEARVAKANDDHRRVTNRDVLGWVINGTIPCIAAAAFLVGILIGILEKVL